MTAKGMSKRSNRQYRKLFRTVSWEANMKKSPRCPLTQWESSPVCVMVSREKNAPSVAVDQHLGIPVSNREARPSSCGQNVQPERLMPQCGAMEAGKFVCLDEEVFPCKSEIQWYAGIEPTVMTFKG